MLIYLHFLIAHFVMENKHRMNYFYLFVARPMASHDGFLFLC